MVVDDQALVRAGFRMILEAEPDLVVVGEANDGLEAIEVAERAQPDIILMDIRMPRLDGVEATARITGQPDPPRVLILTTFDEDEVVDEVAVTVVHEVAHHFGIDEATLHRLGWG